MPTPAQLRSATVSMVALLVVAFLLSWEAVPATADQGGSRAISAKSGRMVMVLDSSGSMKQQAAGGETKIAAAKKALNQVIGSLPTDQAVGLRVYGAKVFSRNDPGACTDSQLVVPVRTGNRAELRSAVAGYKPYGETPIGYALQQAGKDLGSEGKRTIVLVSDGEPTCAPDPCKVARELSKKGLNLKIDVVGLDVDASARQKLQCIAGAGNGTYYDVDSSEQLATSLEKLATRAARPFTAIGQPVLGTPTASAAPTITAGDWLDELGTTESSLTKNYQVERQIPGSTLHVSASLRTATSDGEKVEIHLATPDGTDCGSDLSFTQLSAGQLISAGASANDVGSTGDVEKSSACTSSSSIIATVSNQAAATTGARPLEIRVIEEPPVEQGSQLPAAVSQATWTAPPSGPATSKVTGGSSFDDAPLLKAGVYRDAIVPGEVLTYRVDVRWGQHISATADFSKPTTRLAEALGNMDMFARMDTFSPGREAAGYTSSVGAPVSQAFVPNNQPLKIGTGIAPVTYLNRGASHPQAGASLAGSYTVTVFMEKDPEHQSYAVPFTLRLGVAGATQPAPAYVEKPSNPDSPSTKPTTSGTPSPSPGQNAAADSDGGGPGVGLYVGGVGVLALLGAAYLVFRSRSSSAG